jgi:hypothetical protein
MKKVGLAQDNTCRLIRLQRGFKDQDTIAIRVRYCDSIARTLRPRAWVGELETQRNRHGHPD